MTTTALTEAQVFGDTPIPQGVGGRHTQAAPTSADWLNGIQVVMITTDDRLLTYVKNLRTKLDLYTRADPAFIAFDVETCAIAGMRQEYNDLINLAQVAQQAFENFPPPKAIVDPETKKEREEAKETANALRSQVTDMAKIVQKAGLHPYVGQVRLYQLYLPGTNKVIVIDRWAVSASALRAFADVMADPRIVLVGHNIQFDFMMVGQPAEWNVPIFPSRAPHCTLLQAQTLVSHTHIRKTLAARCEAVLGRQLPKDLQMSDWSNPVLTVKQIEYAAADVVATYLLHEAQYRMILDHSPEQAGDTAWDDQRLLPIENARRIYDLMRGSIPAVIEIVHAGVGFDAERHKPLARQLERANDIGKALVMEALDKHSDPDLPENFKVENPGSPVQIARWMRHHLSISPGNPLASWPTTDTGQLATGKDELLANLDQMDPKYQPVLKALADWSGAKKDFQDYGDAYRRWINPVTGRIHANYKIGGTETGRFSVTEPALQTINRESDFRDLFIPTKTGVIPHWMDATALARLFTMCPGLEQDQDNIEWSIVSVDLGQIQVRIVATLAQDTVLLHAIDNGLDVHALTALACFRSRQDVQDVVSKHWHGNLATASRNDLLAIIALKGVLSEFKDGVLKKLRQIAKSAMFGLLFGQGPGGLRYLLVTQGRIQISLEECRSVHAGLLDLYSGMSGWMTETRDAASETHCVWSPQGRVYSVKRADTVDPQTGMIKAGDSYWYTKSINTPAQAGEAEILHRILNEFPRAWGELQGICKLIHVMHDEIVAEVPTVLADRVNQLLTKIMCDCTIKLFPNIPKHKLAEGGHGPSWGAAK